MALQIGLIGDHQPEVTAHRAIPLALQIAAVENDTAIEFQWLPTPELEGNCPGTLKCFDGLWCVPASPYVSTEGALQALNHARLNAIPLLGSCGGFQHMVIEYARNALGFKNADNAEINPDASMPLIAPLSCALVERSDHIELSAKSHVASCYRALQILEKYNCSYGINTDYSKIFIGSDLHISGHDATGEARAIELHGHPFYIGVAFQPERSALDPRPHPLISAFVLACCETLPPRSKPATE